MSSPRERFGSQASTKGNFGPKYENWKIEKPGVEVGPFRILPPMHSLQTRADGWVVYHGIHFGYVIPDFSDATKTRMRPFECIEKTNYNTKMIEVSCAECRNIELHEKLRDDRAAEVANYCKSQGILTEKDIEAVLAQDKDYQKELAYLKSHNKDSKQYINVMSVDGKFGVLKIPKKMKDALLVKIEEVRSKKGIEPITDFDGGCWFTFRREGNGGSSSFYANVVEEEIPEIRGATRVKLAPLTDAQLEDALKICPDLATGATIRLSAEQIQLLVESGNDPDANKVIFDMNKRENSPSKAASPAAPTTLVVPSHTVAGPAPAAAPSAPIVVPSAAPQVAPVAPPAPAGPDFAALLAQMEMQKRVQAQVQPVAAPAVVVPSASVVVPVVPSQQPVVEKVDVLDPNMSASAFQAIFEIPKR